MKPAAFRYHAPKTVDEAIALLAEFADDDGRVLAGGQSLVPTMAFRLARPAHLVDINGVEALNRLEVKDGKLVIGACVRHAAFHRPVCQGPLGELLADVVRHIAHYPIRNRGRFCGSLAHADPASEWCLILVALDGEVVAKSARRRRTNHAAPPPKRPCPSSIQWRTSSTAPSSGAISSLPWHAGRSNARRHEFVHSENTVDRAIGRAAGGSAACDRTRPVRRRHQFPAPAVHARRALRACQRPRHVDRYRAGTRTARRVRGVDRRRYSRRAADRFSRGLDSGARSLPPAGAGGGAGAVCGGPGRG